jgi:prepilin-type N-terminal cleavage/methylation domain-containing protein
MSARVSRGFTLLELVVAVVAITVVGGLVLDRVLPLVGRAQRTAFLQVQRDLQSSLRLAAAERIASGSGATVAELAASNPMALLREPPANYVGALTAPQQTDVPPGSWYFDASAGLLVYRVGRYTRFAAQNGPDDRIELEVAFVYDDRDADGLFDAARDHLGGLTLKPVHAYEWPD